MDLRKDQKELVERIQAFAGGVSLSRLAEIGGLRSSTLTRFMNNPETKTYLSARTISKLIRATGYNGPVPQVIPIKAASDRLEALAKRMRMTRAVMAKRATDEALAAALGWPLDHFHAILDGSEEPSLFEVADYARRLRVTADFLLEGRLNGLERQSEHLLLNTYPELLEDSEAHTGTDQGEGKPGPRR